MKKIFVALFALGLMSAPAHAGEFFLTDFLAQIFGATSAQAHAAPSRYARVHGRQGHRGAAMRTVGYSYASAPAAGSFMTRASYYGGGPRRFEPNTHTANGERFNQWGLTAAHRTLPMGTRLLVTHAGRSVVVRVNDRGPALWTGRSLDVSRGAAVRLGLIGPGAGAVHVRILGNG